MKMMNLCHVGFVAFLLLTSTSTLQADQSACPPNTVHCAYFTGLSDTSARYIKLSNANVGSITVCFNGTSTVFLDQEGAGNYLGSNSDTYSICSDAGGRICQKVTVDNFVVSKGDSGFVAKPQYFNVDLTSVKNKYPSCDSVASKVRRDVLPQRVLKKP